MKPPIERSPSTFEIRTGLVERLLIDFTQSFQKQPSKALLAFAALFLLGNCAIRAYTGFDGMNGYSHDLFVFLDGGWRVLNGQVPYNDFFTDVGTIVHLQTAFGLVLAGGRAEGLAYAQALTGCGLGIWAYALVANRLAGRIALLFVWTIVLFTISPSLIGDTPAEITAACLYNRYGYALTALLLVEAFYDGRKTSSRLVLLGGFSSGAITALLLFTKISYFLGALFLLVAMLPCRQQQRTRWIGIASGFTFVFVPIWCYMQCTLIPMWTSLRLLAGAKHLSILPATINAALSANSQMLIIAFVGVGLLWRDGAQTEARQLAIGIGAIIAAGAFFLLTNYQRGRVPLLPILGLLLIQELGLRFPGRSREILWLRTTVLVCSSLFILGSIVLDSASVAYALAFHLHQTTIPNSRFDSPKLSGFRDMEAGYVTFVNDGIKLVQRYRQPSDSVASLDFSNPFSYALGMASPWEGTPTGLQCRTNFDERYKLPGEYLFGHASLVMVPNTFTDTSLQQTIPRIYGPYLEKRFHLLDQTALWRLYRRND